MFDRFSSVRDVLIRLCLGVFVFFASACGTTTGSINGSPQILPPCELSPTQTNPYLSHQQLYQLTQTWPGAVVIYDDYKNNRITIEDARKRAFSQLAGGTRHWSNHVDMAVNDTQMVRITITYIDPALVEYVVLNNIFSLNATMDDTNTFIAKLSTVLNGFAERDEMLFMIIITTPSYIEQAYNTNVLTVKIPIRSIALINGSDLRVYPIHDDHILDETIRITHGPVAGVIGYPLAVMNPECTWVIDKHTNALTLDVPEVTLGNTNLVRQFWYIPYRSLIEVDLGSTGIVYDPYYVDLDRIKRLDEPPRPNWVPNAIDDTTDQKTYWEDMGRFIWDYLMKNNDF